MSDWNAAKQAAPNYNQTVGQNSINTVPPPRTVASAISRMEALNERIAQARSGIANIADTLGALRSVPVEKASTSPIPTGAISRLNDSADSAHSQLSEIESLLSAIQCSLG